MVRDCNPSRAAVLAAGQSVVAGCAGPHSRPPWCFLHRLMGDHFHNMAEDKEKEDKEKQQASGQQAAGQQVAAPVGAR